MQVTATAQEAATLPALAGWTGDDLFNPINHWQ